MAMGRAMLTRETGLGEFLSAPVVARG
jgi:hypothetical protein